MSQFDRIVRRTTEKLYEDEQLRANLTDAEACIVLGWAEGWVAAQIDAARDEANAQTIAQSELARVRQTLGALNAFARNPGALRLADGIAALDASLRASQVLTREQVFALLTTMTSAAWKYQRMPRAA